MFILTYVGYVDVQVLLMTQGIYQKHYNNTSLSGPVIGSWIVSNPNFSGTSNYCSSETINVSAIFITTIKAPITGSILLNFYWDDGCDINFNDVNHHFTYWDTLFYDGDNNFTVSVTKDNFYTLYVKWWQSIGPHKFYASWVYSGVSNSTIPNSYMYIPNQVKYSPYNVHVVSSIWADGYRTGSEGWDDGDTDPKDGWSATCTVEVGWICTGGSKSSKDTWTEICGDGIRFHEDLSYWDDGDNTSGDGCSSSCSTETGWTCFGGNNYTKDTCTDICGDGRVYSTSSTFWDDGNNIGGDGWSRNWIIEPGWTCSGGTSSSKDTCNDICGDGKKYTSISTFWDDGDNTSGDGWSSTCSIESGWIWEGGTQLNPDTWTEICGDGRRFNTKTSYCDDGNITDDDGWNSSCSVETGWSCTGGNKSTKDACSEIWGDGIRFNSLTTYCDDGNKISGDGWSSSWLIESGWNWAGGTSAAKDVCNDICGDGKKYTPLVTFCDDGNKLSGDGWSNDWNIEFGWNWAGGNSLTKDIWTEIWGDGIRFNSFSTYWDDANKINGDGWNSSCSVETGWKWTGGDSTTKDKWDEIWGDGIRFNSNSTYCDDGNKNNGDGCNSSWSIEVGWSCLGGTTSNKDICTEIWGDGIRFNTVNTYCDDSNNSNGDGWSSNCLIETGWKWSGGNSSTLDICKEIWGDGIRFNTNSAYCDDGNLLNGDGCNLNCSTEIGWICTNGNSSTKDTCSEIWGDGIRFNSNSTYCDDGNLIYGDGCNSKCTIESGWKCSGGKYNQRDVWVEICGDGIKFNSNSSYCDDGNIYDTN